jgi:photosystem II stability/assembly factor-like uncharacterized protein
MKLRLFLLSFVLLFFTLQAQISIVPSGILSAIPDISVQGKNTMIQAEYNYLVKSYDACYTLIPISLPETNAAVFNLIRLDTNTIYTHVIGPGLRDAIYKSKNGGQNWLPLLDTIGTSIQYIHFFDTLEGITTFLSQKLLRTKDGGKTWQAESYWGNFPAIDADGDNDSTFAIHDGGGGIRVTYDRGHTWTAFGIGGSDVNDVEVINEDTIFALARDAATLTQIFDKGQNVSSVNLFKVLNFVDAYNVCYKSAQEIYVVGIDSLAQFSILKTTNLGATWSIFIYPQITRWRTWDFKFVNDSIAVIVGDSGRIVRWNKNQTVFVGLEKINLEPHIEQLQLFPNPSEQAQTLVLQTKHLASLKIDLMDITGKKIRNMYSGITESGKNTFELDMAQIPNGIYFYEVQLADKKERLRFVKQ